MNTLVFDIETVPDLESGTKIYNLSGSAPEDVQNALTLIRRHETDGQTFMRLPLHRIVAISVVLKTMYQVQVWSLGESDSDEAELLHRFFAGLERYQPTLVSWNGTGFDLPVIHYRALLHGVSAPHYWDTGQHQQQARWNNYLNRYHERHLDLMDVLASYQQRAAAPLDHIATMLGLPGKMGMDGRQVQAAFAAGQHDAIRDYCETDVLNTYLVYLRFELIRGHVTREHYDEACQALRDYLQEAGKEHFNQFLAKWSSI